MSDTTNVERSSVLVMAKDIVDRRQVIDGVPENSFPAMAKAWSAYLMSRGYDIELHAIDVQTMMSLFKIMRAGGNVGGLDSYVDGCAYLSLAGQTYMQEGHPSKSRK